MSLIHSFSSSCNLKEGNIGLSGSYLQFNHHPPPPCPQQHPCQGWGNNDEAPWICLSQPWLQKDSEASLSSDLRRWPYSGIPYLWWQATSPVSLKSAQSFKIPPSYHFNTTERNSRTQQPLVYFTMFSLLCQKIVTILLLKRGSTIKNINLGTEGECWWILSTWQVLESPRTQAPKHVRGGRSRLCHLRWGESFEMWQHHSMGWGSGLDEKETASQKLDSTAPCSLAVDAVWPAVCLKTLLPWLPCLVLPKTMS